jgi:hypothetical protein
MLDEALPAFDREHWPFCHDAHSYGKYLRNLRLTFPLLEIEAANLGFRLQHLGHADQYATGQRSEVLLSAWAAFRLTPHCSRTAPACAPELLVATWAPVSPSFVFNGCIGPLHGRAAASCGRVNFSSK